jgi:hypothetical protein
MRLMTTWRPSVAVAVELTEHRHLAGAQLVVGVALGHETTAQAHDRQPELAGEAGVGAGDLLDGGHVVSLTHYPG